MNVYPLWRRIPALPASKLGWWSVGLECVFAALFMLWRGLSEAGYGGGATFFEHPLVAAIILAATASAIAGGVTSFIAILRARERSLLVSLSLFLALFVFLFALGELGGHQ